MPPGAVLGIVRVEAIEQILCLAYLLFNVVDVLEDGIALRLGQLVQPLFVVAIFFGRNKGFFRF